MKSSELAPLAPSNELEHSLVAAKRGQIPLTDFLAHLVRNDITVPSVTEIQSGGAGFTPLVFKRDDTEMVAIFTSIDRVKMFSDLAPYILKINAREFFLRLVAGVGVVLNPGYSEGMDITPDGIQTILRDFH